jgi:hypothetical protein
MIWELVAEMKPSLLVTHLAVCLHQLHAEQLGGKDAQLW